MQPAGVSRNRSSPTQLLRDHLRIGRLSKRLTRISSIRKQLICLPGEIHALWLSAYSFCRSCSLTYPACRITHACAGWGFALADQSRPVGAAEEAGAHRVGEDACLDADYRSEQRREIS